MGISSVTHQKHTAYGGDTASSRTIANIESFFNTYGSGEDVKCAASSELLDLVSATELQISTANLEKDEAVKKSAALQNQVNILTQTLQNNAAQKTISPPMLKIGASPKPRPRSKAAEASSHNTFAAIAEAVEISEREDEEDDGDPLGNNCANMDAADDGALAVTPAAEDEDLLNWATVSIKKTRKEYAKTATAVSIIHAQEVEAIAASTAAATPPLLLATAVPAPAHVYEATRWDTTS